MKELKIGSQKPQSCDITAKGSSCGSSDKVDLKQHWNDTYTNKPENKLGWFETDLSPTFKLIEKASIRSDARILNVGAGSTTLVDELIMRGYTHIIATDISEVALKNLQKRVGKETVEMIVDDLTNPCQLNDITPVSLWIDRAVLHFLTEEKNQNTYFTLLKNKITAGGYVLLAEFNLEGATKCSGLPIHRYNKEMLQAKLGNDFKLIESFNYIYTMPSGNLRPYVYTLFKKQ